MHHGQTLSTITQYTVGHKPGNRCAAAAAYWDRLLPLSQAQACWNHIRLQSNFLVASLDWQREATWAATKGGKHRSTYLYDPGKVTQVEGVMGLGGCGQQLGHGLAVHVQGGCNDAWAQLATAVREATCLQVPAQYGLKYGH